MKVLIIGLGSIASKHIAVLSELDASTEFIALRSSETASLVDQVRNIYEWSLIDNEAPDFIIISNPTSLHFETIQKLKDFSIPLFIEKPLFSKIGSKEDELVKEIKRTNTPNYIACNLRFLDSIQKLKKIVDNERINEVNVYCGSFLPEWRPGVDFRKTYSANKEMGGGVHIDLIHELDYIYWLFGPPENTHSVFKNNSSLEITAYDYANYLWEYNYFCVSIVLNYYRREPRRSIEVVCETGIYYVDLLQNTITYNNKLIFSSEQRIKETYKNQMIFFIDKVLKGKVVFNSVEEANNILKLCLTE